MNHDAAQKAQIRLTVAIIVVIIALERLMALPIGLISPATVLLQQTTANHSNSIETMFHLMKPRCLDMSRYK